MKVYVALVISDEPIDIKPEKIGGELRHCVVVGLDLVGNGHGGFFINQAVPEYCDGRNVSFVGNGPCVSFAITAWLKDLCASSYYKPLWQTKP